MSTFKDIFLSTGVDSQIKKIQLESTYKDISLSTGVDLKDISLSIGVNLQRHFSFNWCQLTKTFLFQLVLAYKDIFLSTGVDGLKLEYTL